MNIVAMNKTDRKIKRMRVLSICPISSGGVTQFTHFLSNALSDADVDVTMITPPGNEFKNSIKKYRLITLPIFMYLPDQIMLKIAEKICLKRYFPFRTVFTLLYALLKKPNFAHIQWAWNGELKADIRLIKILQSHGVKVIYTAQNILPHEEGQRYYQEYRQISVLADAIIALSPSQRRKMISLFGLEQDKVYFAPTGIYNLKENRKLISKSEARKLLGLNENEKVVLFFGYIREYKGLDILLKAIGKIREEIPNLKLIIAGKLAEDFRKYHALMKSLGIEGNTFVRLGYIPLDSVDSYFISSDIVVLPYKQESLTAIIFLAYFYNKPVVGTDVLGVAEFIEDGKTGYIAASNDENDLAKKMESLLLNEPLLDYMGSCIEKSKRKYSWEKIALLTKQVYTDLID